MLLLNNKIPPVTQKKQQNSNKEKKKTCKHCGKKYLPSKSDAQEPNSYCSADCNTEAGMAKRNKDADVPHCKSCGKEIGDYEVKYMYGLCEKCLYKAQESGYHCKDCGTEISKSQYNSHEGLCPSCARSKAKKYDCPSCGKPISEATRNANDGLCDSCWQDLMGPELSESERGGQTLCGNCEKPIPNDSPSAFCSKECEEAFNKAHGR